MEIDPNDINKYRVTNKLQEEESKNNNALDEDENDCSICLFAKIEVVLPCGHAFCEECITDWLKK